MTRPLRDVARFTARTLMATAALCACAAVHPEPVTGPLPVNWPGELPAPGPSSTNPARTIARPEGVLPRAPDGFKVDLYAEGLAGARYLTLTPEGSVLVSLMDSGLVVELDDQRRPQVVVDGLRGPYGLAFIGDALHVADVDAVRRFDWRPGERQQAEAGEVLVDISAFASGHVTRTLLPDAAGGFFLSIGSASNVSSGEAPERAAISRYAGDGSGGRLYATGVRNGVGLRLNPVTGALWATSQERDHLGDDLVPDYLTEVVDGGFYGWPFAYTGPHEDPRHAGKAPEQVAVTRYPSVLLGAHVGALDFLFHTGTSFPERYRNGAFVAEHGSWNHSRRVGYQVVFVPFEGGQPVAGPEPFLTGFSLGENRREVWGRPVGLLELPDGSLLVSDDTGGVIWRVSHEGPSGRGPK
jgi:glucose/arabinose dehydrogenase